MAYNILIAGATGNLGSKTAKALIKQGAVVRALVRADSDPAKVASLQSDNIEVVLVDMKNKEDLKRACTSIHCVVSVLSGLAEVVIDAQKTLLDAAIDAGVPRFIPSDYSLDFTPLVPGQNRNLDLRRTFHQYLDKQPIKATTIFNGAFMDLITGDMPLILYKLKRILYWGDPAVKMDLTLTDDVAAFTAKAALDAESPRYLRIAGDTVSALDVQSIMNSITGEKYGLLRPGSISVLNRFINVARFFSKNTSELYPAWQGMQYMRDMMEGRAVITTHDNDRYAGLQWTSVKDYLVASGKGK